MQWTLTNSKANAASKQSSSSLSPGSPLARSFAQFSMSERSNDCARGEPGDEAGHHLTMMVSCLEWDSNM